MNKIYILANRYSTYMDYLRHNDLDQFSYTYINGEERGLKSIRPDSEYIKLALVDPSDIELERYIRAKRTFEINNCIEIEI